MSKSIDILQDTLAAVEEDLADHKQRAARGLPLKYHGISLEAEIQTIRRWLREEYDRQYNTQPL